MGKKATELRYAVRLRVVLKYFGQLCLVIAALSSVPLVMSLVFAETHLSLRYAVIVCGLTILGVSLNRVRAPSDLQANEGMVLVACAFLFGPLAVSYALMGSGLSFLDALFEAISGVTTTGLSMKATLVGVSPTFLFSRAWMQWCGGLGIVAFSLVLVVQPGLVAKGLTATESEQDDLIGGTRARARRVLAVYVILTALGVIGSLLVGVKVFDAVLYTFAAVSTGSFAPHDGSLAPLGLAAQVWITLLCLAGAIPIPFYYRAVLLRRRIAPDLLQLRAVAVACVITSLLLGASMRLGGMPWGQIMHHAPLLAFSAQTTAGFSSMPVSQLHSDSKVLLLFSMLLGAGAGSTAGGFKLIRLLIAASVFRLIVVRTCLPRHTVVAPRLAGRRLEAEEIQEALILILLFVAVVALSWLPFVARGYGPLDSLFEVVSAAGTAGLSVGLTSAALPPLLKGTLCVDMLMGRLEIIAWLVLLYPGTWLGRRREGT